MILIADSGSTKTDWRLMDGKTEISQIKTKGFNPYYQNLKEMVAEIESELVPAVDGSLVDIIHFYGAGCSTAERQQKISDALSPYFTKSEILVQSDLIGAARALSGESPWHCVYSGHRVRLLSVQWEKHR
jgi:glucosamine kinase